MAERCRESGRRSGRAVRWKFALTWTAAATVALSGCGLLPSEPVSMGNVQIKLPPPPPLPMVAVRQGTVSLTAQVAGRITSTRVQNLYFHDPGRVGSVNVQDGSVVKAGQVLASLYTGTLAYQVQSDALAVSRARLALAQVQQQDQLNAPTTAQAASAQALQLHQATLNLRQAELVLAQIQRHTAHTEVIAPFAGVVNDVAISPGDMVQAFEVVMDISDPSSQAFIVKLDSTTAQELTIGAPLTLTMTADPKVRLSGRVASIFIPTSAQIAAAEQSGNPSGIPSDQATLQVNGLAQQPPLGAAFTATIRIQQQKQVLYVPSDAVRQFNGTSYVELDRNGVLTEQPVHLGLQGDTTTAIVSGVHVGEKVVE